MKKIIGTLMCLLILLPVLPGTAYGAYYTFSVTDPPPGYEENTKMLRADFAISENETITWIVKDVNGVTLATSGAAGRVDETGWRNVYTKNSNQHVTVTVKVHQVGSPEQVVNVCTWTTGWVLDCNQPLPTPPQPSPLPTPTPAPTPTPPVGGKLPTPTNFFVVAEGLSGASFRWDAVPGAVKYRITNGEEGQVWEVPAGSDPFLTFAIPEGLSPGSQLFQLAAIGPDGEPSDPANFTVNIGTGGPTPTPTPEPDPGNGGGGGGDPGCDPCQQIAAVLQCPEWGAYMGAWGDLIRNSVPPAPNWGQVAGIMRDTIVPAMMQEFVNRSPEVARIIADELQRREKPVTTPKPIPTFNPTVPQLQDITAPIVDNINSGTPDFTPDFSGSKPFSIPDPMDLTYDNTDKGFNYPDQLDDSVPAYRKIEQTPSPDKGYTIAPQSSIAPPAYEIKNPTATQPMPDYKTNTGGGSDPMPTYNPQTTAGPMPSYKSGSNSTPPPYKIRGEE